MRIWRSISLARNGISLANKCLLLFGAAVILILTAALGVAWLRMNAIVEEGQLELARVAVDAWKRMEPPEAVEPGDAEVVARWAAMIERERAVLGGIRRLGIDQAREEAEQADLLRVALAWLDRHPSEQEYYRSRWRGLTRMFQYVVATRAEDGSISSVIQLERQATGAAGQVVVNAISLASAGLMAGGVAILVFYLITTRLILGPVRALKETAELVRTGDLDTRSDISTGDEFEELSRTFNQMLEVMSRNQRQLRAVNASLDLKVNELAERNIALYEANKLKGDFLASVSHELKTPLNSIIGFAELLRGIAEQDAPGENDKQYAKRLRYLDHIITSGRSLLDMINDLLEMARLEAGKREVRIETISLMDACEAMIALISPQAQKSGVDLDLELADNLPLVQTDPKKFQQIIFNLLSNAVKFTAGSREQGRAANVTLRAERIAPRDDTGPGATDRIRVSVLDTGPGIAPEDRSRIFEKFTQLDAGHTREHAGTGLGLAICRELASLLQGEIQVESELGRGSMFSVILPTELDQNAIAERKLELSFRGALMKAE